MDGSHLSPKSSVRTSSRKPTYSGNRENEHESDSKRGISRLQKPPANTKNFMSPTISAASKAVKTRRKKILTERNEDSSSPRLFEFDFSGTKTPNLVPKSEIEQISNPNSSRILSHSDNKDEKCENSFRLDDTTTDQPYDPIKNYLSPRPKYLRYRPNRRREIFLCQEIEAKFDELSLNPSVSFDSQKSSDEDEETLISGGGSSISCSIEPESKHGTGRTEIIENLEDEEAIDEEREEGENWTLKWVLKLVLVFLSLVLSTAYISTMNSPTPPPALQFIRNLKNEYRNVEARILRKTVMGNFATENDDYYEPMEEASEIDFFELEVPEIGILEPELPEDGIMVEIPDQVIEVVEDEEAAGERIESNYDHHLLEETGDLSGHTDGDIKPQEIEILESMVDLSYVSLSRVLDHHEPAMLPPTYAANELPLSPSWCSSYPSTFSVGQVAGDANKTTEAGGYQAATAPTKPVLLEAGNDNDLKLTYDYKHGYAPNSLMYGSAFSLAALVYVATLFYRRRRARRSSQTIGSEGGVVGDGIIGREERPAATIEQVEEGLLTTHAGPSPPIQYGSPIPYVEFLSVRGTTGKRRSLTSWMADSAQQQPTTSTTDTYSYGSLSGSRDVAGPRGAQQPTTLTTDMYSYGGLSTSRDVGPSGAQQPTNSITDIHSYGSFIGEEVISKKKNDSKDGATLTPVRRSTRLRSRGAKSP